MKIMPDLSKFMGDYKERNAQPKSSVHSLELVITVILFFIIGRFLDSKLDTTPLFTVVFGLVGIVGSFLSAYYRYLETSKKLDKDKAWANKKTRVSAPTIDEGQDELIVPKGYGTND